MRLRGMRVAPLVMLVVLLTAAVSVLFNQDAAHAAQITPRRLTLQAGVTDGGSMPGGTVNHFFEFTVPSNLTIGSIQFLYCTTASGTCNTPAGLDTTDATLGAQTGITGFSIDTDDVNGSPYITRTPAINTGAATYRLDGVVNPSTTNQTFYVRISTFASDDITGGSTDTGVVAASTATQIELTGTMPESLVFCTGEDISTTSSVPDCSTATPGDITFNDLFSTTTARFATSQMAASTNADQGYVITVAGETLTSGSNSIPAIGNTPETSTPGTGQFGLNLVANTTPAVTGSANVAPAANAANFRGQPTGNFDTDGEFTFDDTTTNTVAASNNGGAGPTDAQIFTVSYIVNVAGSQAAGEYTTTLTYVCTPTF